MSKNKKETDKMSNKIGKIYRLKKSSIKWMNDYADEVHTRPNGEIDCQDSHNFSKNSKEVAVFLTDFSRASTKYEPIYVEIWISEIGLDCAFVSEDQLGSEL